MKTQEQQDEIKILSLIMRMRRGSEEPICCTNMILTHCTGIPIKRCIDAVCRLVGKGELISEKRAYSETDKGRQRYSDAVANPQIPVSLMEWKEAALTGAVEGKTPNGYSTLVPSDIENPAIPGPETWSCPDNPEFRLIDSEKFRDAMETIAKDLGIGLNELLRHYSEGRLRVCKHLGRAHWGIFDKKKDGWKAWCRRCTKDARRANAARKKS